MTEKNLDSRSMWMMGLE